MHRLRLSGRRSTGLLRSREPCLKPPHRSRPSTASQASRAWTLPASSSSADGPGDR